MYILLVHWLGKFRVSLKAPSRYRFAAHNEHQQSEFSHIFKRICPFGSNPLLHNLLITPSPFVIHDLDLSVVTLFFFSTYSKTFASKNNSWSYSVNPISKYCHLDSRLSLAQTQWHFEWNILIAGYNAVGGFWEQWVFLLNDMLYRFWYLSNQ